MDIKTRHVIDVLESWERAYLAPSATIAIKAAREALVNLANEVAHLKTVVKEKNDEISALLAEQAASQKPKAVKTKAKTK